jgi:hypothetical protein
MAELVLQALGRWQVDQMMFHLQAMLWSFQVIELGTKGPHMFPLFRIVLEDPVVMYRMMFNQNLLQVTHTHPRNCLLQ